MGRSRRVALAALMVAALAASHAAGPSVVPDAAAQDATSAAEDREWNQAGGGPAHASVSSLAPIRGEPQVAWRFRLPGDLACEPVAWGGVVFVVAGPQRARELFALRAATGEVLGTRELGGGERCFAAVWRGTVIVSQGLRLRGFPLRPDGLGNGWSVRIGNLQQRPPRIPTFAGITIDRGLACVQDTGGTALLLLDATTGKSFGAIPFGSAGAPVFVQSSQSARAVGWPAKEIVGVYGATRLRMSRLEVAGSAARPEFPNAVDDSDLGVACRERADEPAWLAWAPSGDGGNLLLGARWTFVRPPRPDGPSLLQPYPTGSGFPVTLATRPAIVNGRFYGFSADGALHAVDASGRSEVLVERADLPDGARAGPATLIRDVLCFGNWAVDVGTRQVLWCLPVLAPRSAAVPVADGRIVVATAAQELVCLAEPAVSSDPAAVDPPAPASQPRSAPAVRRRSPEDLDGVLLLDGTRVDGTVEATDSVTWQVTSADGSARTFDKDALSLAVSGGKTLLAADDFGAYAAWRDAIEDEAVAAWSELVRTAAADSLVEAARSCLARARLYGIGDQEAETLERLLTGLRESTQVARKLPGFRELEAGVARRIADRCVEASRWLAARGFVTGAGAILADAARGEMIPNDIAARAAEIVPPEFPSPGSVDVPRAWIRWARELVPAGARFCGRDDPAWARIAGQKAWASGTIALRTRNLLLFSRCTDLAVVGACVRNGEGAVRALDALLWAGSAARITGDADRLEVRLHANRDDYLAEAADGGESWISWTAGYYMPSENVSRFFVPSEKETEAARERTLFKVLAHELTHHYIDRRFCLERGRGAGTPGCWVVEGIARFVEDQTVETGRRGLRFDDATVHSIDAATQLGAANALLLPLARFLDLTRAEMLALGLAPVARIRLRSVLHEYWYTRIDVFYDEAGAFVFWMMHRRGAEGREAFLRYVRAHYAGRTPLESYRLLGFTDAAQMEREFLAFLKSPEK